MSYHRSIALRTYWSIEEVVWRLDLRVGFFDNFKKRACHLFRTEPVLAVVTAAARPGAAAGLPSACRRASRILTAAPVLAPRAHGPSLLAMAAGHHALARDSHRRC